MQNPNKKINLEKAIKYADPNISPSIHIFEKNDGPVCGIIYNGSPEVCKENDYYIKEFELDENKISNSENQLLELVKQLLDKGYSIFVMYQEKNTLNFTEREEYYTKALDKEGYYGFFVKHNLSYEPGYFDAEIGMFADEEEFYYLSDIKEYDPIYNKLIEAIDELDIFD